ncbi:uncharacterized protein LOC134856927 [Symsagittifera roscoffensis]|uniref:uncharacterized protein LOC134856927 n=1 Tax=Symsagittifera roscoffensis TaxID=84072 RepID=UPI00307C38F4
MNVFIATCLFITTLSVACKLAFSQRAPDVSELTVMYYDCYPEENKFTVKFKQLGYQQVVSTYFRNKNVDRKCKHIESIHDEAGEWIIGFLQQCEIEFEEASSGRFEVKIFDGPIKMNHIRDSRWIDCTPSPPKKGQDEKKIPDRDIEVESSPELKNEL